MLVRIGTLSVSLETEVVNRRVRAKVCVSFATVADVNERTVTSIV